MAYKFLDATPCPVTWSRDDGKIPIFEDILDSYDDDTAAIDFTNELGSLNSLAREKPRRVKRAATFKIHEDAGGPGNGLAGRKPLCKGSSMFSQPAQRLPRPVRATFGGNLSPKLPEKKQTNQIKEKRVQAKSAERKSPPIAQKPAAEQKPEKADSLKRDKRRNTIYIPPDDTTMATVFMGAFSPLDTQDLACQEIGYIEAQIAKKRKQHKSPTPRHKRQPLESPKRVVQELSTKLDVMGKSTGKENVPPGQLVRSNAGVMKKKESVKMEASPQPMRALSVNSPQSRYPSPKQKAACSPKPSTPRPSYAKGSTLADKPRPRLSPTAQQTKSTWFQQNGPTKEKAKPLSPRPNTSPKPGLKTKLPSELILSRLSSAKIDEKYPVLTEDIADPSMYEENWLSHQEVVITQLANTLFAAINEPSNTLNQDRLNNQLLDVYQDPCFSLLHKRVQVSLLHGELRVTNESNGRGSRLKTDVGLRRKFMKFWMDTYDISALQAAAETVIGRRIGPDIHEGDGSPARRLSVGSAEKGRKRAVASFLEAMLIRNEDMDSAVSSKAGEGSAASKGDCRTALRSIMMIVLLDKARMAPETALPRLLFKPGSAYKSSAAVLRALGPLLHHPQGDFTRPLTRLECFVEYQQHPLAEYNYQIGNIAVDIRDGIILARLTELLLLEQSPDKNQGSGEETRPLSRQLKVPCISRATKVHNVQVSLTALANDIPSIGAIISGIKPEDIVDGYREKTIALLWAIIGKWGLSALVDWDDLKKEIVRLEKQIPRLDKRLNDYPTSHEQRDTIGMTAYYSSLLHRWASCLARLKGLEVSNLTTSLADGRVFASIIDEYEYFIRLVRVKADRTTSPPSPSSITTTTASVTGDKSALNQRLLSLGCSSQFVSLLAPRSTSPSPSPARSLTSRAHILHQESNIAALAFLSSRLLSASKYGRAAVLIQRAWRHKLATSTRPGMTGEC
ncbi:uncharacterized protein GIQ15_06046 [Arthroderma uncinatum]|uniref:uncharacterized protein n=1 Tax=Arthroderma uncinatum TaxID=74035 RepID=UPI00144A9E03|nr:uncharacterized protein GIQ15_06046 [Arthroderma uncinatum]KAF3480699.1 hypothetical protein GIQ15_06046 [Arthroderma uncinatum]